MSFSGAKDMTRKFRSSSVTPARSSITDLSYTDSPRHTQSLNISPSNSGARESFRDKLMLNRRRGHVEELIVEARKNPERTRQLVLKLNSFVQNVGVPEDELLEYSEMCKNEQVNLFHSGPSHETPDEEEGPTRRLHALSLFKTCLTVEGREKLAEHLVGHDGWLPEAQTPFLQRQEGGEETTLALLPLHVAVARGQRRVVNAMLTRLAVDTKLRDKLVNAKLSAPFQDVQGTCLEGELPLCIAALNGDVEMIETLLSHGADLEKVDSTGDNIIHNLIKTLETDNPLPHGDIALMVESILQVQKREKGTVGVSRLLFQTNDDGLTPLLLATKVGASEVVRIIASYPGIYKFTVASDLAIDNFMYDITEVDSAVRDHYPGMSVLQLIQNCPHEEQAYDMVGHTPIRNIINLKWQHYRKFYFIWMTFHIVIMSFFTWAASQRYLFQDENSTSYRSYPKSNTTASEITDFMESYGSDSNSIFRAAAEGILLMYAIILFTLELYASCNCRCSCKAIRQTPRVRSMVKSTWRNFTAMIRSYVVLFLTEDNVASDGPYRFSFMMFSVSVFCATLVRFTSYQYDEVTVSLVLASGWWCTLYFTRAITRGFSFFTVMIHRSISGDLSRFLLIYMLMLVGFSSTIFLAFRPSRNLPEEFESFGASLFTMFQLSVGLAEIGVLQDARYPSLAYAIFIAFVILSYVLLFNMLIAMLSNTCSFVSSNQSKLYELQKLSMLLLIERRTPRCLRKICGSSEKAFFNHGLSMDDSYDYCARRYLEIKAPLSAKAKLRSMYSESDLVSKDRTPRNRHSSGMSTLSGKELNEVDESQIPLPSFSFRSVKYIAVETDERVRSSSTSSRDCQTQTQTPHVSSSATSPHPPAYELALSLSPGGTACTAGGKFDHTETSPAGSVHLSEHPSGASSYHRRQESQGFERREASPRRTTYSETIRLQPK